MKIFIGCSSSDKVDSKYFSACEKLIESLFTDENELVFGAMNNGLMGLAYKVAKKYKRKVTGIAPKIYEKDFEQLECDVEILCNNITDRIEKIINTSDAFVFLPGGVGTTCEIFSLIESKRSEEFDKPILIYNCYNFFEHLIKMLDKIYSEKFSSHAIRENYLITDNIYESLKYISTYIK